MALTKQIRELHDEVPAYQRLGALHRQAPKHDCGEMQCASFCLYFIRLQDDQFPHISISRVLQTVMTCQEESSSITTNMPLHLDAMPW